MKYNIINDDCLNGMATFSDNHFHSSVTDPPYGLNFMGKNWDHGVPNKIYWKEVYRVLRHGGHLLAFGGTRMFHRLMVEIEDAGFEIRDTIMWVYGVGFPKGNNIGKSTGLAEWQGWNTNLKPAWEPIIVARKPVEETVAQNVMKYGTGGINIDGCRVESEDLEELQQNWNRIQSKSAEIGVNSYRGFKQIDLSSRKPEGRYPANLIHDGEIDFPNNAARFFYCAKANPNDRDEGNNHPTVKPTNLMQYLCRLVTPKDGIILDPFCGSGSTGKAAILEGFNFVGIEKEADYAAIATKRCEHALQSLKDE